MSLSPCSAPQIREPPMDQPSGLVPLAEPEPGRRWAGRTSGLLQPGPA